MRRRRKLSIGRRVDPEPDVAAARSPAAPAQAVLVLPDGPDGPWRRSRRWGVLVGCFFAGAVVGSVAYPWIEPALVRATHEVRAVAEAGFAHSADRAALGAPPPDRAPVSPPRHRPPADDHPPPTPSW